MVKRKKKFWTPMKIIITIVISLVALFFIAKIAGVEFPFLSSSVDAGSSVVSGGMGNGGGTA